MIGAHGPFTLAGVRVEAEEERRARLEIDLDEASDQLAMLERWIETRDYDAARAGKVGELGRELIEHMRAREGS
jgi:hypothetical protein